MSDPRNNGTWCVGVVSDPEIKDLPNGSRLLELRVALDRAKRSSVNPDDTTAFFNVVLWDNGQPTKFAFDQVEAGNLKKGSQLMITGAIQEQEYTNKEGVVVSRWGITANGLTYQRGSGEGKSNSGNSTEGSSSSEQPATGNVVRDF